MYSSLAWSNFQVSDPSISSLCGELDTEGITVRGENFGDDDAADDDVCCRLDRSAKFESVLEVRARGDFVSQSEAGELGSRALANNACIASNLDLSSRSADWTANDDDLTCCSGESFGRV